MPHWFEEWHGIKLPSTVVSGLSTGGGSTAMSTGVALALSSKAALVHGHSEADIIDLVSSLAGLAAQISTKAAGSHTHAQADVTDLTSSLAGLAAQISTKAASTHTHAVATASTTGFVPVLPANSTTFLRSDATWASPPAGGPGGGVPSTWATLSTHVLTGSTTMQSVTGLSFAVSSASIYRYEFSLAWQSISSATGLALGVNGPASPLLVVYEVSVSSGLGGMLMKNNRAFGVQTIASPGSSAANLDNYAYVDGITRTGANAGTLQLQFASEVAGSTVSIRAGSVGLLFGPL